MIPGLWSDTGPLIKTFIKTKKHLLSGMLYRWQVLL